MAAPIPDNSYGSPSEEGNRQFRSTRGVRPRPYRYLFRGGVNAGAKRGKGLKKAPKRGH